MKGLHIMKIKTLKLCALISAFCIVFAAFGACSATKEIPESKTSSGEAPSEQSEAAAKYGDAEVYKKGDSSYAKTDDGIEVELSEKNLQRLFEEYTKVQGSGSDKEKELLNQIQLILEAPRD